MQGDIGDRSHRLPSQSLLRRLLIATHCCSHRYELAAGATKQQLEEFDGELMKKYDKVPVDGKAGKKAAAKSAAGAKPAADAKAGNAAQQAASQHVPPAPGTPVSASSTPSHRAAAARERTPEDTRSGGSGGEPATKRPRLDSGAAAEPQNVSRTAASGGAAALPQQRPTGGSIPNGHARTANGTPASHPAVALAAPAANGSAPAQQNDVHLNGVPAASGPVSGASGGSTGQPQPSPLSAANPVFRTDVPGGPVLISPLSRPPALPACSLSACSLSMGAVFPEAGTHTWAMAQAWLRLPLLPRHSQACRPRRPTLPECAPLCLAGSQWQSAVRCHNNFAWQCKAWLLWLLELHAACPAHLALLCVTHWFFLAAPVGLMVYRNCNNNPTRPAATSPTTLIPASL